ncbi:MAG: NTP transferase domain-containing protein, partial [Bacteroidia bacterium]|nr:NTP transferase domain-containing protein [Bacteroidia bacterium]
MEVKTAIILAGGFGTRLQSVIKDVPKPMAPVNGIPFLNYQINYLKHYGIKQVILSVGYLHSVISEYYKNEFNGVKIFYAIEETALGTGGGIRQALELSKDELVLALNGDSFFDIPLDDFAKMHEENKSQFSLATRKVADASRYGTIETDVSYRITSFKEKDVNKKEG